MTLMMMSRPFQGSSFPETIPMAYGVNVTHRTIPVYPYVYLHASLHPDISFFTYLSSHAIRVRVNKPAKFAPICSVACLTRPIMHISKEDC
jgi:hypothetical protein